MTYGQLSVLSLILIAIADVIIRVSSFIELPNGSTQAVTLFQFSSILILIVFCIRFEWNKALPRKVLLLLLLFMIWNIFQFFRGLYNVQDYWDLKFLLLHYLPSICIPFAITIGLDYQNHIKTYRFVFKVMLLIGFLFIPFSIVNDYGLYARVVIGIGLFLLFLPYVSRKWQYLLVTVSAISIFMDLTYRSNVLRLLVPILLVSMYFIFNKKLFLSKGLNFAAVFCFCLPLIILSLGVTDNFNIFEENIFDYEVSGTNIGSSGVTNLATDTRTFLYQEVLWSMDSNNSSLLIGEGGGSAYESDFFSNYDVNYRGRYGSEVGLLNSLLYSGIVGIVLYASMLFISIYYGINRSNNYLTKMIAIFLAFHWILFFIEDRARFDMNNYFIWMAMGICLSNEFRAMSEADVKNYFVSILKSKMKFRI